MSALTILKFNNPALYKPCAEVTDVAVVHDVVYRIKDTLDKHPNAMAIAANQIGLHHRVVVMKPKTPGVPSVWINPVILESSKETCSDKEGCLSFPGLFFNRNRPNTVKVQYQDIFLNTYEITVSGIEAVCIQHEIEHLNGQTFISHLPKEKQLYWMRKSASKRR